MKYLEGEFLIANALLYDGSGAPPFDADVAVRDGFIAAVARAGTLPRTGLRSFDAHGAALAPGFVDIHGHSDTAAGRVPDGGSKLAQGVTLEAVGNCGFSDWIVSDEEHPSGIAAEIAQTGSFARYAELLDRVVPGINIAAFCGHNSLRLATLGAAGRAATGDEIAAMKRRLAADLAAGAAGFSSGLWYVPGKFAPETELCELASALKGTGKPYATHLRCEGEKLVESIEEACRIAEAGAGKLQLSHLKTFEAPNWNRLDGAFAAIERGKQRGVEISADRYPYLWSGTSLRMIAPGPFARLDRMQVTCVLRESPEKRNELRRLLEEARIDWSGVIPVNDLAPEYAALAGMNFFRIAAELRTTPEEACVRLLAASSPGAVFQTMCQENLDRILDREDLFPGSDGNIRALSDGGTHPRAFGTHPLFFRLARRHAPAEQVIRRMSALPAQKLNLPDRGMIAPGFRADLVLFDPERYDSKADFVHANVFASGVEKVFVNGCESYRDGGEFAPARHGEVLRIPNRRYALPTLETPFA